MKRLQATRRGEAAGRADAKRYDQDPATFEATANPFGVDSEAPEHEAWADGYENTFEVNKTKP